MTEYFRALAVALEGASTPQDSLQAREGLSGKYDMEIVGPTPVPRRDAR